MRKFKCHKMVEAEKITKIGSSDNKTLLHLADGTSQEVSDRWTEAKEPAEGGYLVKYEDGYLSYSPAKIFEDGYTEI